MLPAIARPSEAMSKARCDVPDQQALPPSPRPCPFCKSYLSPAALAFTPSPLLAHTLLARCLSGCDVDDCLHSIAPSAFIRRAIQFASVRDRTRRTGLLLLSPTCARRPLAGQSCPRPPHPP